MRTKKALAWHVVVLWAIVALTGCTSSGKRVSSDGAGTAFCTRLDYSDMIKTAEETALPPGVLRVPVVVHLMDRHNTNVVKDHWAEKNFLRTFFATEGKHSVNQVWAVAGIRLDVELVEHCHYPEAFLTKEGNQLVLRMPDPAVMRKDQPIAQQETIDRYLEINRLYGRHGKLNVYIWERLSDSAWGYGESPRRNRIEVEEGGLDALATAWYRGGDLECDDAVGCQNILAHELGHALGLKHVCRACTEQCCTPVCWTPRNYYAYRSCEDSNDLCFPGVPEQDGRCCCGCEPGELVRDRNHVCGYLIVCCDTVPIGELRLMYIDAGALSSPGLLCDAEIHSVRSAVRELFPGKTGGQNAKTRQD